MSSIRPFEERDYDVLAALANVVWPEPVTAEQLRSWDAIDQSIPELVNIRRMAEYNGVVVGRANLRHTPEDPENRWSINVAVFPEARKQGFGSTLFDEVLRIAREHGATLLRSYIRGGDEASLNFAKSRGFYVERERTESVLDLQGWDSTRFAPALEKVRANGISLISTRKVESEELLRGWYELEKSTYRDVPGMDQEFPPIEVWRKGLDEPTPKEIVLALDGDKVAGVSIVGLPLELGQGANTHYTGVLREYRGRGIALAVKLLTVEAALRAGAAYMRTNNDPDNPAMLAVNEKMGYRRVPGPLRLERDLVQDTHK